MKKEKWYIKLYALYYGISKEEARKRWKKLGMPELYQQRCKRK